MPEGNFRILCNIYFSHPSSTFLYKKKTRKFPKTYRAALLQPKLVGHVIRKEFNENHHHHHTTTNKTHTDIALLSNANTGTVFEGGNY